MKYDLNDPEGMGEPDYGSAHRSAPSHLLHLIGVDLEAS